MHDAAVELFQMLVSAGAVPGEDFSSDHNCQAYRLNQRCLDLLQRAYPEVDWNELCLPQDREQDELIESLHVRLGVPFVANLVGTMGTRLHQLSDSQAVWYLHQILVGLERGIGLQLLPRLQACLSPAGQLRLEWLLRQNPAEPCQEWIYDLVLAAGGSPEDLQMIGEELWLSERGLDLLELLWAGDYALTPMPLQP